MYVLYRPTLRQLGVRLSVYATSAAKMMDEGSVQVNCSPYITNFSFVRVRMRLSITCGDAHVQLQVLSF